METLWDIFWFMVIAFIWIAWIMLLFRIFVDIFRADTSGWAKAGWAAFVIFLPFLGVLVYLISQGGNMAKRDMAAMAEVEAAQRDYIKSVSGGGSSADELQKLASLKESGVLSEEEFAAAKAKILA